MVNKRRFRVGDEVVIVLGPFRGRRGVISKLPWFAKTYQVHLDGDSRVLFRRVPQHYLDFFKD